MGHCVFVFAFLPALILLPEWLLFELKNPLNYRQPLVLAFVFVRGVNALLDSFAAGVVPGIVAGAIDGVLVSAWTLTRSRVSTMPQRLALGAISGILAGCAAVLVVASRGAPHAGRATVSAVQLLFGIAFGVSCGMVAAPTAVGLLTAEDEPHAARQ